MAGDEQSASTEQSEWSLTLVAVLYICYFVPQLLLGSRKRKTAIKIDPTTQLIYMTASCFDLVTGFVLAMHWKYRLVSAVFTAGNLVQWLLMFRAAQHYSREDQGASRTAPVLTELASSALHGKRDPPRPVVSARMAWPLKTYKRNLLISLLMAVVATAVSCAMFRHRAQLTPADDKKLTDYLDGKVVLLPWVSSTMWVATWLPQVWHNCVTGTSGGWHWGFLSLQLTASSLDAYNCFQPGYGFLLPHKIAGVCLALLSVTQVTQRIIFA